QPTTEDEVARLRDTPVAGSIFIGPLDDAGLEKMSQFPWAADLTELEIVAPRLTDDGFAHLAKFKNLRGLTVQSRCLVTDGGLKVLDSLPHLRILRLPGSAITDK